jgi:hypothetical protein
MSVRDQLLIAAEREAAALTAAMQDLAAELAGTARHAVLIEGDPFAWREAIFDARDGRRLRLSFLVEEVDDE